MRSLSFVFFILFLNFSSYAGPKCASQSGQWSQVAVEMSNMIERTIQDLSARGHCDFFSTGSTTSLIEKIGYLKSVNTTAEDKSSKNQKEMRESLHNPSELQAINSLVKNDPNTMSSMAKKLLVDKTLKTASVVGGVSAGIREAANSGLDLVSSVFDVLGNEDNMKCIRSSGIALDGFLLGSLKLANSVSGSPFVNQEKLNTTMQKVLYTLETSHISNAFRSRATVDFWNELSCLIESVTDGYCGIRDAQEIDEQLMEYSDFKETLVEQDSAYNPLEAYFVITRDIPNISSWVLDILFGHEPVTMMEANRKNLVWETVVNLIQDENSGIGIVNEKVLETASIFKNTTDLNGKKAKIIEILRLVHSAITGKWEKGVNFILSNYVPQEIPFVLLGMDVPPPVTGQTEDGSSSWKDECGRTWQIMGNNKSWEQYLSGNGNYHCKLNDPDVAIQIIRENFKKMMKVAKSQALDYLNEFLVVDEVDIVSSAYEEQGLSVVDSLYNVNNYLLKFRKKLERTRAEIRRDESLRSVDRKIKLQELGSVLGNVNNLLPKVSRVMKALEKEANLLDSGIDIKDIEKAKKEVAVEVIKTVFNEFKVIYQQSNFLKRRLKTYVNFDMRLLINEQVLDENLNNWLIASSNSLLDLGHAINDDFETSYAVKKLNIENALYISNSNLSMLETFSKDYFIGAITSLNAIIEGNYEENGHFWRMLKANYENENARARFWQGYEDSMLNAKTEDEKKEIYNKTLKKAPKYLNPYPMPWDALTNMFKTGYYMLKHKKRYPWAFKWDSDEVILENYGNDGSIKALRDKYCIQALFYVKNRALIKGLCEGAEISNEYVDRNYKQDDVYERKLKLSFEQLYSLPSDEHHQRVCALRDYKRNTHAYLLLDKIKSE